MFCILFWSFLQLLRKSLDFLSLTKHNKILEVKSSFIINLKLIWLFIKVCDLVKGKYDFPLYTIAHIKQKREVMNVAVTILLSVKT